MGLESLGARVARLERGTHCTAVRSAYALLEELRDREVEEPQADARDHHSAHEGQQLHLVRVRARARARVGVRVRAAAPPASGQSRPRR